MPTETWFGDRTPAAPPPKPGRWIARPRKPRWILPAAAVGILASQAPNWINLFFNTGRHLSSVRYVFGAALVALFAVVVWFVVRDRLARRVGAGDATLLDGGFGEQFAAEVTIVAGKKGLGSDRGVVWFADGLIGFSGASASFVLAAWDVEVAWTAQPVGPAKVNAPVGSLVLAGAPVDAYVAIHPLGGHMKAFRERLRQFERESASAYAERFWPPLESYEALEATPAALS